MRTVSYKETLSLAQCHWETMLLAGGCGFQPRLLALKPPPQPWPCAVSKTGKHLPAGRFLRWSSGPHTKHMSPSQHSKMCGNEVCKHPGSMPGGLSAGVKILPPPPPSHRGHTQKPESPGDIWETPETGGRWEAGVLYPWMSSHENPVQAEGALPSIEGSAPAGRKCGIDSRTERRRGAVPVGNGRLAGDQRDSCQLIHPELDWATSPLSTMQELTGSPSGRRAKETCPEASQFWGNEVRTPDYASSGSLLTGTSLRLASPGLCKPLQYRILIN